MNRESTSAPYFFFVFLVLAIEENSLVGSGRPLGIKGGGDFDSVQVNFKRFFAMGVGYVFNMQEFIPPGKGRGKFAEGVPLNVFEVNIEMNELGIFHRSRDREISIADYVGKVGVVTGVSAYTKAQARILIRIVRGTPSSDSNPHDAIIRQEPVQVPF